MGEQHECQQCVHFRDPIPLSHVLERQVSISHEEVAKALDEIASKDETYVMQESAWLSHDQYGGMDDWPHRPRTVAFCGLHEADAHYLVCEVKNADGQCQDFQQRTPPTSACERCARFVSSHGDEDDGRLLGLVAERLACCSTQHAALQSEYRRLESRIGARKAYEIREAYRNSGWLPRRPAYLDSCTRTTGRFDVPQCVNARNDCQSFVSADGER